MADRGFYPSKSYGSGLVTANFRFTMPGSGTSVTVSGTTVFGADIVATIAHVAGTQVATVTLKDKFSKVLYGAVTLIGTTGKRATIGAISNEGSSTAAPSFTIYTWAADGTADNDNASDCMVSLALRNGSWGVQ